MRQLQLLRLLLVGGRLSCPLRFGVVLAITMARRQQQPLRCVLLCGVAGSVSWFSIGFLMRHTSPDRLLVTALRFILPAQLKCTPQRSRSMSSRCWSVRRMSVFWPRWSISSCGRRSRVICSAFGSLTRYISLSVPVARLCASWELLRPYAPTVIMILMVTVIRDGIVRLLLLKHSQFGPVRRCFLLSVVFAISVGTRSLVCVEAVGCHGRSFAQMGSARRNPPGSRIYLWHDWLGW